VLRIVVAVRGQMELCSVTRARFDYGECPAATTASDAGDVLLASRENSLRLRATVPLTVADAEVRATFSLQAGEVAALMLDLGEGELDGDGLTVEEAERLFDTTVSFWRSWLSRGTYRGRWREMVERSALTLKLLTHRPTGAILAAPTTSLPEQVGGERNWDYRFVWSRDAAFSAYAHR
jgi:GH15 family glucan-1,4-alpha-glucosidase